MSAQREIISLVKRRGSVPTDAILSMLRAHRDIRRFDPPKHERKIVHVQIWHCNKQLKDGSIKYNRTDQRYHWIKAR